MAREHEPGRHRELRAVAVVQERLRLRALRQLTLLQAAHEHRTEPARADVQRVREQDAGRAFQRAAVAHLDRAERGDDVLHQRGVDRGEAREFPRRVPQLAGCAGVMLGIGAQHVRLADVRRGPDRVGLGDEELQLGLDRLRVGERVQLAELPPAEALPVEPRLTSRARLGPAHRDLEPVREVRGRRDSR